jgi:uncharacterized protein YyaL (SSP411 family)
MPNHLANETSPYLHQHADNRWTGIRGARRRRAREDRQQADSLSIGYAAITIYVMAHIVRGRADRRTDE